MTRDDLILQTLEPATHDLGGFKVYRTLPHRERTMVGPFLFFDQMGPAHLPPGDGVDVRPHPHIGLSTVTYLFDGAFQHRDSLGTDQRITPGAVNLMTAGSGIVHSEMFPLLEREAGNPAELFQVWLNLPSKRKLAQQTGHAFEHFVVARQCRSIARRELRHRALRVCQRRADAERTAVRQRQKIRQRTFENFQAVSAQPEVGNDLRVKQADRVARCRIAKARMKFLGDRCAADHAAPFKHAHSEASARKIAGADEAVVAAANDDGIGVNGKRHGRTLILPDGIYR